MCSLQEPATAPISSGKKIHFLALVNSWPQSVSPGFDVGFSLLAMRVVGRKTTVLGSLLSVSSLVKMF